MSIQMLKSYQMMQVNVAKTNNWVMKSFLIFGFLFLPLKADEDDDLFRSKLSNILHTDYSIVSSKNLLIAMSYTVVNKEHVFWIRKEGEIYTLDVASISLEEGNFSPVINSRPLSNEEYLDLIKALKTKELLELPRYGLNEDKKSNLYVYIYGFSYQSNKNRIIIRDILESRVFDDIISKVWIISQQSSPDWKVVTR
jgi:hypothetical protein